MKKLQTAVAVKVNPTHMECLMWPLLIWQKYLLSTFYYLVPHSYISTLQSCKHKFVLPLHSLKGTTGGTLKAAHSLCTAMKVTCLSRYPLLVYNFTVQAQRVFCLIATVVLRIEILQLENKCKCKHRQNML